MPNIQISINKNRTTTLATKGTYNAENIDIITNVPNQNPYVADTETIFNSYVTADNVGCIIKYTGATTAMLKANSIYQVYETSTTGTYSYREVLYTGDATATEGDILTGKNAYINGTKVAGTMANNGTLSGTISEKTDTYTIPAGYTSGGSVGISDAEKNKIIASNIRYNAETPVTVLGVTGEFTHIPEDDPRNPASATTILRGYTAWVDGAEITGTMDPASEHIQTQRDVTETELSGLATAGLQVTPTEDGKTSMAGVWIPKVEATENSETRTIETTDIRSGVTILGVTGSSNVVNTEEADNPAVAAEVLADKVAYVNGNKIEGSMPNKGAQTGTISTKTGVYTIPEGYHNGSGTVAIASAEQDKLISSNIKSGVTILGVAGDSNVVDTSDATAVAGKILSDETAYVKGEKITGTMANNGAISETISTVAEAISVPAGYTTGGTVSIDATEQAKLVSANIKAGVTVLGVTGKDSVVDTADGTATNAQLLNGYIAYSNGVKLTGTIQNYTGETQKMVDVLPGGTATNVVITTYTAAEQDALKTELTTAETFTEEELEDAVIINVSGDSTGTVILDVSELGNVGDSIKLVHKKSNNSWEVLFDGVIPADKKVEVTFSSFSPVVGCKLTTYVVSGTVTNMTASPALPTTAVSGKSTTIEFNPATGYTAPNTITVGDTTVTAGAGATACYASGQKICDATYTTTDITE